MKTKLLFLSFLFLLQSYAQSPITTFYGQQNAIYTSLTSVTPIDQTPTGANVSWNFSQLANAGSYNYTYASPTLAEVTTFPGSTMVTNITTTDGVTKVYSKDLANIVSITGVVNPDLTLNYITNNALVGTFPLNFGDSNTDAVAGNYTAGTITGTFTGTAVNSLDAHGTLVLNDVGYGPFSGNVTRIKTTQNLSLNFSVLTNIGTVVQTIYNYYEPNAIDPVFRYSTTTINVPLASINQTITTLSRLAPNLATNENNLDSISNLIFPNPVENELNINNVSANITKVIIYDAIGKKVKEENCNCSQINVSELNKGFYVINIITDQGLLSKKFIKK